MSVFWLALAAFAIGTEGFVIAGLLPGIAADLQISVSAAGQLVTAYALTYAVGSPILAVTLNNVDRRTVLALALSTFIAGNLVAMMTSGYMLLLASRMLMALGAGLCMPTALGVSVAVASPERRGRAVALVTSGITVATVVGVPLGNFVGSLFGWRATLPWSPCSAPLRSPASCSACPAACRAIRLRLPSGWPWPGTATS